MKVNGTVLDNRQENFIKELMGDVYMPDARAESLLARTCAKYKIDPSAVVQAVPAAVKASPPAETL